MGNKVLTVNIRETNEKARRRVYKSKQLDKKIDLIKKIGIGLVSASIAAGAVGHTIISGMVADAKNAKDTKEAIILAAESDEYLKSLRENPIMNQVVEQADIEELEKLNDAITTYKYYAVTWNNENKAYVETLEQATEIVEQIKTEHSNQNVELDLSVSEIYTENKDEIETDEIEVAETFIGNEVEEFIESETAIAKIQGINISVLPVSGKITSRFGEVSSIRSRVPHTGLDLACTKGTSIKVVADGTVVFAGWSGDYGNLVKVDHGNGLQTWYAHCSKIYVSEGDKVSYGDVISAVGSTGNSTGPHLHFEIRIDGKAVNPQDYVY